MVRSSVPGVPGWWAGPRLGLPGHPFAEAVPLGMMGFAGVGRSGSIRRGDHAKGVGGHDLGDPLPAERSRRGGGSHAAAVGEWSRARTWWSRRA